MTMRGILRPNKLEHVRLKTCLVCYQFSMLVAKSSNGYTMTCGNRHCDTNKEVKNE